MIYKITKYLSILYRAAIKTVDHDGVEHAGYMSFLNILSLFPFLVFIVALASFIGKTEFATNFAAIFIEDLPGDFIAALKPRINEIISGPPQSLLTLSILGAIWTSSSTVEGLRTILNKVYRVRTPPTYLFRRFLSIVQFLVLTMIIISCMFLLVLMPILYHKIEQFVHFESLRILKESISFVSHKPIWFYARKLILVLTLFFVISMLYYILPNIRLSYKSVIPGTTIAVLLWLLAGNLLATFISNYKQASIIYGSLAGIIFSMLFFYVINMIFIYGAEINYLLLLQKRKKY